MQEKAVSISLPNKIYFRIGEVSEYTGVKPYVLRYWESEFDEIVENNPQLNFKKLLEIISVK